MTTFAYISKAESKDIAVLSLDPQSGDLAAIETAVVATDGPAQITSMPLAISPDEKCLYAGLRFEPYTVVTFAIDPKNGRLRKLGTALLPDAMAYIATDRTGRYLLGASYHGNKLSVSAIDARGLVPPDATVIPTGKNAHAVLTDPSNRYLFATNLGDDVVLQRKFDAASGAISDNAPAAVKTRPGAGPRHFRFHPNGRHFYLINELDGSLNAYSYDGGKGTLSEIQSVTTVPTGFTGKPSAADIHITPDGRFLYGSERGSSTIACFSIDAASGRLTALGNVETETQPRGFAIDPRGRYLLAVGQVSHSLSVYAIDTASGALTRLKRYPMGQNPQWVEIIDLP